METTAREFARNFRKLRAVAARGKTVRVKAPEGVYLFTREKPAKTCGAVLEGLAAWADFCDRFVIYPFNDTVAWRAAEIFHDLRKRGVMTGENDLWIAATALEAGGVLVTRNVKHFREVRGLKVVAH